MKIEITKERLNQIVYLLTVVINGVGKTKYQRSLATEIRKELKKVTTG